MIKRKKKICKGCGEEEYLWARGKCQKCAYDEKPPKKISKKKEPTGELELFKEIWEERHHICEECSVMLPEFNVAYFAHILGKGASPRNRLNKNNIVLLCLEHHTQLDFGDKKKMKIFKKLLERIMELKRSESTY